ncbi:MAG: dTMP kinase [Clostridiales bacterium]|nr:dTMP kinase [Clostridiales bacterium]
MYKDKIISIEGGDGSGKTTIIKMIETYFIKKKINYMVTREPGGVKISESIREIILNKNNTEMDAKTEALLYAAARRQHLAEKVVPQLSSGKVIIFDRYVDSSVVYQGYVRGLGMEEVYNLNLFATEGFLPGLTILLDVEPEIGLKRISENNREKDRLDLEGVTFHKKVREGYLKLAEDNPDRIVVIDANKDSENVFERMIEYIIDFLED